MFKTVGQLENNKDIIDFKKRINLITKSIMALTQSINSMEDITNIEVDFKNLTPTLIDLYIIDNEDECVELRHILKNEYDTLLKYLYKYSNIIEGIDEEHPYRVLNKFSKLYREKRQKSSEENKNLTLVDLFCGAGGLSLGFYQEGYKILLANDIEQCCVETYRFNHPDIPVENVICGDVKQVVERIDNIINEDVDIVIGGPPCQSFSMANRQRIIDDPRNNLYKHFVECVKKIKPKIFLMENVKGMLSVAEQVKDDFENIGYAVDYFVFNAKDYSVPQSRERLIYIGNNIGLSSNDIIKEIRENTSESFVLKDALFNLKSLLPLKIKNATEVDTEESGKLIDANKNWQFENKYLKLINKDKINHLTFNHKARYNNDRDIEIFSRMHQGDKSDSERIADIMPYKDRNHIFKDKYYKLVEENLCKTITAHMKFDCNMYIHPTQPRGLTPREAARVQSYPDDYLFLGSYTKTYMQIGNSVPPLMARTFAKILKKYLKDR